MAAVALIFPSESLPVSSTCGDLWLWFMLHNTSTYIISVRTRIELLTLVVFVQADCCYTACLQPVHIPLEPLFGKTYRTNVLFPHLPVYNDYSCMYIYISFPSGALFSMHAFVFGVPSAQVTIVASACTAVPATAIVCSVFVDLVRLPAVYPFSGAKRHAYRWFGVWSQKPQAGCVEFALYAAPRCITVHDCATLFTMCTLTTLSTFVFYISTGHIPLLTVGLRTPG